MNEHWHDDPGWEPGCHLCHVEDGWLSDTCEDCIDVQRQAWEDLAEKLRAVGYAS